MLKKIRVTDLEPGMFISDFNTPWLRHPFFPSRMMLRKARDIDRMLECGMTEVYIDTGLGRDSPRAVPLQEDNRRIDDELGRELSSEPAAEPAAKSQWVPFEAEFRRARELYTEARKSVRQQFEQVRQGRTVDAEATHQNVTGMVESIFRNKDALVSLSRIRRFDEYTFRHSINVAVLSLNLAVSLGIVERELMRLGIGAVLHDMGKVRLPEGLIQKPGRFDDREYEIVKTHALHGASIILESKDLPAQCSSVPLGHHERYDGSGYPRSLTGLRVGKFGLITAVADVYDAMTSDRPYQKGMPATLALRKIYGWAGTHFHPIYVRRFIQCIGIYPVGSVVRLDTGELGVVVRQNPGDLLRPWVRLVLDRQGAPLLQHPDVDLRTPDPRGEAPYARSVQAVLSPGDVDLDVEAVLAPDRDPPAPSWSVGGHAA